LAYQTFLVCPTLRWFVGQRVPCRQTTFRRATLRTVLLRQRTVCQPRHSVQFQRPVAAEQNAVPTPRVATAGPRQDRTNHHTHGDTIHEPRPDSRHPTHFDEGEKAVVSLLSLLNRHLLAGILSTTSKVCPFSRINRVSDSGHLFDVRDEFARGQVLRVCIVSRAKFDSHNTAARIRSARSAGPRRPTLYYIYQLRLTLFRKFTQFSPPYGWIA